MIQQSGERTFPRASVRRWAGVFFAAGLLALGIVSCQRDTGDREDAKAIGRGTEKAASIHVHEGNGWLASGGEILIAEWHSGLKDGSGDYYASFRGANGGATVDLRITGLHGAGEFTCGSPEAGIELRVDVRNAYVPAKGGACRVIVTRFENGIIEGRYTAELSNRTNDGDAISVSGTFRASRPPRIAAASAQGIGMR